MHVRSFLSFLCLLSSLFVHTHVLAQVPAAKFAEGEYIVKLKVSSKDSVEYRFLGKVQSKNQLHLKNRWRGLGMYHFKAEAGTDFQKTLDELRADPDVEFVEPNYIYEKASILEENETLQKFSLGDVQALSGGSSANSMSSAPIQTQDAWAVEVGTAIPIVAVIDTGLDTSHSVFANSGAVWTNPGEIAANGIDDDGNGYIDDINGWSFVSNSPNVYDDEGHGTHVAGIVLGATQNIFASTIEPAKIRIMPIKFLDANATGKTSDAVKAIYYAVQNGATVLSNSWGGAGYSAALHEAISYAYDQGVAFVAASGNNASNNDFYPLYPANINVPNVLSVAATTDSDSFAYFSNFGISSVHMASPGYDILSTYPGGFFVSMRGTSMATPFVSGVAAMMQRERPAILGYQLKQIMMGSTNNLSILSSKTQSSGRLNALNAVVNVQSASIDSSQPVYTFSSQERALASEVAGCGTVVKMYREMREGKAGRGPSAPTTNPLHLLLVIVLLSIPLVVYRVLRNKKPEQRRKYDRYKINTDVRVSVNGRELVGSISSISLGGAQIDTSALLEQGGVVKMSIVSPDGSGNIDVEGRVVWSESKKSYGVQFQDAKTGVLDRISGLTKALSKT